MLNSVVDISLQRPRGIHLLAPFSLRAGKSSVLEALSGVSFPRGSGLTTRCPIQLVMKVSNQPWLPLTFEHPYTVNPSTCCTREVQALFHSCCIICWHGIEGYCD